MKYTIHITKTAESDLEDAANYIEFVLKNPTAADKLYDSVEEKLSLLSSSPEIHPIVDDPVLKFRGIRFVTVNNYLAFYVIDEENKSVYIVRFLFKKRDWITILKT